MWVGVIILIVVFMPACTTLIIAIIIHDMITSLNRERNGISLEKNPIASSNNQVCVLACVSLCTCVCGSLLLLSALT